jgi:quinol monooxygenase YgiN
MSEPDPATFNPTPSSDAALPLDELELTPQWVKAVTPSFRDHTGEDRGPRKHDRGFRDRDRDRGPRPDRPPRARTGSPDRQQKLGFQPHRDRQRAPQPQPPREITAPVEVAFLPEEKGFAAMLATMKESRRAYALFDLAKLVLNKPERHQLKLTRKPAADGARAPLHVVIATEQVFLSQDQALRSIFQHHADLVCKETKTPVDPPKGNFLFVSRCGFTGEILGPPNYHEYQSRIVRHHQERLRHVSFEEFKSRIQSVKDPEAVKAWMESMSTKTEYECLLDAEPKKFANREELHRHVAAEHLDKLVSTVPETIISGPASRKLEHPGILEAIREAWVSERRFPLKTANGMQTRLRREGFSFFKHRKGITYICATKPKRFEAGQTLTEHVQKIVAFLRAKDGCTRKQLLDHLVPASSPDAPAAGQEQLLADLHWLIQDGYVVEFHNGRLTVLEDRPPKPSPPPAAASTEAAAPAPTTTDPQPAS